MSRTTINFTQANQPKEKANCHLMPCKIKYNNDTAKVKEYFLPTIRLMEACGDNWDGRTGEENKERENEKGSVAASFRGRPLHGKKILLPDNYIGSVVKKSTDKKSGNDTITDIKKLDEFTYWNWDQIPSKNDPIVKAIQWLEVSKAIHS